MRLRYERVEKQKIKTRPQARKVEVNEDLHRLANNLFTYGQLQPVGLLADYTMIWGHRRLAGSMLKPEITHLWAAIFQEEVSESQFLLLRATENFSRQDLTAWEKYLTCKELMEVNPSWQGKDLAEHLKLDPGMVTRLLSPGKCIQAVRDALEAGKVGMSDSYSISRLSEVDQAEALALKLNGASRDDVEQHARKKRNGDKPTVRVSRIKCAFPGGACVTVAGNGDGLSLDEIIENLGEVLKAAKKANEEGIDARTFQRVLADKAKN